MPGALDLAALRRAMEIYAEALRRHREELDSLNVYPVPDGDTGTNLLMTQDAVVAALRAVPRDAAAEDVGRTIARASLMGARGNSGVILSQILRGIVEELPGDGTFEAGRLAAALQRATDEAYRAVARPVEGTILSVLRDSAVGARAAVDPAVTSEPVAASAADVLSAAVAEAEGSLGRTKDELAELRHAGVVDAGAKGLVLLLDSLAAAVEGREPADLSGPLGPVGTGTAEGPPGPLTFATEVQYLLEAADGSVPALRRELDRLGDSVVVVGGGGLFNVHVHTNRDEDAVEAGRRTGHVRDVEVSDLAAQVTDCIGGRARGVRVAEHTSAFVAVAEGEGLARTLRSLGAVAVLNRSGDGDPEELVRAMRASAADGFVVLGVDDAATDAANRAMRTIAKPVRPVAVRSMAAALSAAAAFNPMVSAEENAAAMGEAAGRSRSGALARNDRGAWLGMVEDEVVCESNAAEECAANMVRGLAFDGSEVLTLIVGADPPAELARSVEEELRKGFADLAVEVVQGGQPRPPFLVGVE